MLANRVTRWMVMTAMAAGLAFPLLCPRALAGDADQGRKVKVRVQPVYPELAKRMNLAGTVKCQVVVAANGTAKSIKPVGGNPVLIEAVSDALKKWRWEPGDESTEVVEFHFSRDE